MRLDVQIKNSAAKIPDKILEAAGGSELCARIFMNRGFDDPGTIRQMLDCSLYNPTRPDEFPGMGNSVDIIEKALKEGEKIAVYGDYDVDGVTSTALLVETIRVFTDNVIYHVPDRFKEGYGMNMSVIEGFSDEGVGLIITCDCGISNSKEINLAKELGMKVIVTDHHTIPDELPGADVILNPKLLDKEHRAHEISGCGMAFFLCQALLEKHKMGNDLDRSYDLLAMSLVADVVSLTGENRYLLKKSIPKLFNSSRLGIKALFTAIGNNLSMGNEEDIAFQIAPRINAAGRMETARLPVELLLCNEMPKAIQMANRIDILNKERKKIQGEMVEQAKEQVEAGKKSRSILVLYSEFWHHGIIGIAAGKICETYGKPVIMLSMKEDGKTVVGSARSITDINIYELIKECSRKLVKFGGHAMAAGLSLHKEQLEAFTAEIEALAQKKYFIKDVQTIEVDMELSISQITEEMDNTLNEAGPYGEGFLRPVFFSRAVEVVCDRKTEANHHIMLVSENDAVIHAVKWFGDAKSYEGRKLDIVYTINKNRRGESNILQLNILNIGEESGKASKKFNGEIYDARGLGPNEVYKEFGDAVFFHEGFKIHFDKCSLLNRYGIKRTDTLVFLSTPVNSKVFKEVVLFCNPSKIVLNFSYLPDYSFKGFVMNLLGIVKHFIEKDGGYGYLEDMAIKLTIEESVVIAGLKYLKAMGKIDFILDTDYGRLLVLKGKGGNSEAALKCERNLINALDEKKAFRDFISRMDAYKFKEYLR